MGEIALRGSRLESAVLFVILAFFHGHSSVTAFVTPNAAYSDALKLVFDEMVPTLHRDVASTGRTLGVLGAFLHAFDTALTEAVAFDTLEYWRHEVVVAHRTDVQVVEVLRRARTFADTRWTAEVYNSVPAFLA
jgi:hypothetical protein